MTVKSLFILHSLKSSTGIRGFREDRITSPSFLSIGNQKPLINIPKNPSNICCVDLGASMWRSGSSLAGLEKLYN